MAKVRQSAAFSLRFTDVYNDNFQWHIDRQYFNASLKQQPIVPFLLQ